MKYSSLKRQEVRSFKVKALDGGLNCEVPPQRVADNQITACSNMWYKDGALRTRPGFCADIDKAYQPEIFGYTGELEYKVTDSEVYIDGVYYRIATSDILTDDYAHYTYVYLVDLEKNIFPIGNMAFLRLSSDTFYRPQNILFFNGKSQNGGIFALVTLRNQYNYSQKNYYIYEVNSDYTEWERVYDYYVPTISINGRGNKYQIAKSERGLTLPNPQTLESPNILNGKFTAYFTSDGYSTSFNLPFAKLGGEKVVCRIYYTFVDFAEWEIPAGANTCTKDFFGKNVKAVIDREIGALYFVADDGEFAIPVMDLYNENNIKVTATKDIENGFAKIVHSTCFTKCNTKLLLSGGMDGNMVYVADFDNPLYFPLGSATTVGEDSNEITALTVNGDRILAFKSHEIYRLNLKEGAVINEISLLNDSDKIFKNVDKLTVQLISDDIGCVNKNTIALSGKRNIWLSTDNTVYSISAVGNGEITALYKYPKEKVLDDFADDAFALASDDTYIFVNALEILVCDITDTNKPKTYFWQKPKDVTIGSGFYHNGEFYFLCGDKNRQVVFVATLGGDDDTVLYTEDDDIKQKNVAIESKVTTKHYDIGSIQKLKNIDSVYLLLSASGKVEVAINGRQVVDVNLKYADENEGKNCFKLVKLLPHLYSVDTVFFEFVSQKNMSIGEIEILYRVLG